MAHETNTFARHATDYADFEQSGILPRVRIPLPNAGELRKLLFDRSDLDQLIERWKEKGPAG